MTSTLPPNYSPSNSPINMPRLFMPTMPVPAPYAAASGPPEAYYLGTPVLTSVVPTSLPGYSPDSDVTAIRDACHGMGTRNNKLIKVLVTKGSKQMQVLLQAYKLQRQKDLITLLKDESSGVYKNALVLLASGALSGDAYVLSQALKSQNKQYMLQLLAELIIGKSKDELALLRNFLLATKQIDLDNTISGAVASENKTIQAVFTEALKHELPSETLDLERDYATLKHFLAGNRDRLHTILPILLSRSAVHLNQLADKWCRQTFNTPLADSISLQFKNEPEVKDLFLYAVGAAQNGVDQSCGVWHDAQRIEEAIAKKNEFLLMVRLVRAHWDEERFKQIVAACECLKPGKARLVERVGAATGGNLKTLLKEMITHASS